MSSLGASGSFGPISGSFLPPGPAQKSPVFSSSLSFLFPGRVDRGTNASAADGPESTSSPSEGRLQLGLGRGFASVTAVSNVPILSSVGRAVCVL